MIHFFKRLRFVIACGLFMPITVIVSGIWLASSVLIFIGGCLIMPIEYTISGDVACTETITDYFWNDLPELYDKHCAKFFENIHPDNI